MKSKKLKSIFLTALLIVGFCPLNLFAQTPAERDISDIANAIIVTEINYHAPGSPEDIEFIELYNNTDAPIDMTGFEMLEGVIYNFSETISARGFLILAVNSQAVKDRFNYQGAIAQWSTGSLNNGGEYLSLMDTEGKLIFRFRFDDVAPWPLGDGEGEVSPDEGGSSIVLPNPGSDYTDGSNWRVSRTPAFDASLVDGLSIFGSPGELEFNVFGLSSAVKDSDTQITVSFNDNVQTNGSNPGDFTVTDGAGTSFAVSAQTDGTAGDAQIVLIVADLSAAIGDLTIVYTNNNNEITDLAGTEIAETGEVSIDLDNTVPSIVSASRDSDTQITLTFDEPVQTNAGNPTDFTLRDGNGISYTVTTQADGTAKDNQIVLTTADLSQTAPVLALTYTNNNNELSDFGGNDAATFVVKVCPAGYTCVEESHNICSEEFTLNGGRVVTYPDPVEFDTVGTTITQYNFTFDRAEVTPDVFQDAIIAESGSVTYQANTNTTGVLSFDKSQNHWVNLNALRDDLNGKSRSVFMWVKAEDNTSSNQALFAVNAANGDNLNFLWIDDSGDNLEINRGGTTNESASFDMGGGVWHYVGWSYDHTTGETVVYVNGIENDRFTTGTSVPDLTAQYSLGQEFDGGNQSDFYNGDMAEISVWDEVLTPAEIRAAMRTRITNAHTAYDHLVGYYSIFGECDDNATTLEDHSGKGNDGTFENGLTQDFQNVQSIAGFNAIGWYEDLSWRKDGVEVSAASVFTTNVAAGNYEFTATRNFVQSTDAWSMTLNDNASTVDNITDETLCEDDAISRSVTANTVNFLDFERSESNSIAINSLSEDLINTNYSVFLWVKKESFIANGDFYQLLAFQDSDTETTSRFYITGSERVTLWDGANFFQSPVGLSNDTWYFVGFTFNTTSKELKLYINDNDALTSTSLDLTITDNWLATLGARYIDNGLTNYLDGQMAEITIWDKVLTEEEIADLRTTAPAHNTANLVAAYGTSPGIADSQLRDLTGNGHDGLASHGTIFVNDQEETFTDYDASANHIYSWKKGETEFDTDATGNITVEEGATAYSVTYGTPLFQKTDAFSLSYTNLIPNEPSDQTEGVTGTAIFEVDEIPGATYQWYKVAESWENTTRDQNGFAGSSIVNSVFADGGTIYAAADRGLSISTDGGENWTTTISEQNGFATISQVKSVFAEGDKVYVGTNGGLSISTNGGANWTTTTKNQNGFGDSDVVTSVYAEGDKVYASLSRGGLSMSVDGGANWTTTTLGVNGFADTDIVNSVYAEGNSIYAGTNVGLSISTNGGSTWTTTTSGQNGFSTSGKVNSVFAQGNIVYAGTELGLSISTDGGANWTTISNENGFPDNAVFSVFAQGNAIYAGTFFGVAISSDGGATWTTTQRDQNGFPHSTVNSVYAEGNSIYVGTNGGVAIRIAHTLLSDNADNTADNQIQGANSHRLTINNLTLGQDGCEVFVEVTLGDCTQTSDEVTLTVLDVPVVSIFSPANGAIDVAIDTDLSMEFSRTVSKSTGELRLFNYATDALIQTFTADELTINGTTISVTPTSSLDYATQYYVTMDADLVQDDSNVGNLARTDKDDWSFHTVCEDLILTEPEDQTGFVLGSATFSVPEVAGASYQWFNSNDRTEELKNFGASIVSVSATDNGVFVGTSSGLYRSVDNGQSFIQLNDSTDINVVLEKDGTLYVGYDSGLGISTDNGQNFTIKKASNSDLPKDEINNIGVFGNTLYLSITDASTAGGVVTSTDKGESFERITFNDGLGNNEVYDVFASGDNIYVANKAGLSISTDGGNSFVNKTSATNGLISGTIRNVVVSPDGTIYAASSLSGISISTDGGATFSDMPTNGDLVNRVIRDMEIVNNVAYIAVRSTSGGAGIYATSDGGQTLNTIFEEGFNGYRSVSVSVLNGQVYAGGAGSVLLRHSTTTPITNGTNATAANYTSGATTATLNFNNLTEDFDQTKYFVVVTKGNCEETSETVTLSVICEDLITTQPANQTAPSGGSATFSVPEVAGATYQWYKKGLENWVTSVSGENGFPNNTVLSVFASSGTIYAATDSGLGILRSGNTEWEVHTNGENNLPSLNLRSVYESNDNIYVGTSSGLAILRSGTTIWEVYQQGDDNFPNNSVRSVYESGGTVYAATNDGLAILRNGTTTWEVYQQGDSNFPDNSVTSVYELNGTVYAATDGGLAILRNDIATWEVYQRGDNNFPSDNVLSVYATNEAIYAGTFGHGLAILADDATDWVVYQQGDNNFPNSVVNSIIESNETLYVGTDGGLAILSTGATDWQVHQQGDKGFPNNRVRSVYVSNGSIIVGTVAGLSILQSDMMLLDKPDNTASNQITGAATHELTINNLTEGFDQTEYFVEVTKATCQEYSDVVTLTVTDGIVDDTPPANPVITGVSDDTGISDSDGITTDQNILVYGTAEANSTIEVSTQFGPLRNTAADANGDWVLDIQDITLVQVVTNFTAVSVDGAGNRSGLSNTFVLTPDFTAPDKPVITGISEDTGVSDNDGITSDQNILIMGTAEPNATVEVSSQFGPLRNTTADANGDWTLDIQDVTLVQVVTNLTAEAVDLAGNRSGTSNTFVLTPDFIVPANPVITGISDDTGVSDSDGITSDENILIMGTAEPNATVEVSTQFGPLRNATADANGDWVLDIQDINLVQVVTNFTAEAVDLAGNRSGTSNTFVLIPDFTAPANPVITGISDDTGVSDSDGITSDQNILVYGTAEPNSTVEISTQFGPLRNTTSDANGDWELDIQDITLVQIVTHFTAEAVDPAGNRSATSDAFTLTPDFTAPDKPVITGISDDTGSSNSDGITNDKHITISGTAEANATVEISSQFGPLRNTTADANGDWVLDITDITLIELTVSLTAEAVDEAGNRSATSDVFVLTPDFTAPGVTISVDNSSAGGYTITVLFDEEVTGLSLGGITVAGGTAGSLVQNTTSSYSFFVSLSGSTVDIQVSAGAAQDVAGNDNTVSNQLTLGLPPNAVREGFTNLSETLRAEVVNLYPNPASTILTIDLSELSADEMDISLYNMAGNPVFTREAYSQKTLRLDVSAWTSGMYIVQLYDGTRVFRKKVMVSK